MIPYDRHMVSRLLKGMPLDRLSTVVPADFQRWPAEAITPANLIRELIANEKSRRQHVVRS